MRNILEEYLVKLGVEVDNNSIKELDSGLKKIDGMVGKTSALGKNIVKAGGLIGGIFLSVVGSATALTTSMAKQDRQMQTLGNTMMIGKSQAMAMKQAVDALGVSIQDIQINPELRQQYTQLLQDGRRMMDATGSYEQVMRDMRGIMFEFTRLKQEAQAALRWIAYYIIRDFSGPLNKVKNTMHSINEWFINNMPKITRSIATGFGYIINVGASFVRLVKTIWKRMGELWDSFPPGTKKAIAALTAMGAILMSGPIGWITAGIVALLLLLDDFYGYLDGKDAALGPVWDELLSWQQTFNDGWNTILDYINRFFSYIEDSPLLQRYVDTLWEFWKAVYELGKTIAELLLDGLSDLFSFFKDTGTVDDSTDAFATFGNGLLDIIDSVTWLIKGFTKLLKKMKGDPTAHAFWKGIKFIIDMVVDATVKAVKGIGKVASIIAKLLKGDFAGAMADIGGLASDIMGGLGIGSAGEDEIDAAEYLMKNGADLGIGQEEAAAIAANLMRESSLNPNALIVDSNGRLSGGIAQWNADRLDSLKAFASANGADWTDKKVQLDYLLHELRGSESGALAQLLSANGVGDKSFAFAKYFERPDLTDPDVYSAVQSQRGTAHAIYNGLTDRLPKPGTIKYEVAKSLDSDASRQKLVPYASGDWGGVINDMLDDAKNYWNKTGRFAPGGNSFASNGDTNINVAVNVNTNASPGEIGRTVASKVSEILPKRNIPVIFNGGSGIA